MFGSETRKENERLKMRNAVFQEQIADLIGKKRDEELDKKINAEIERLHADKKKLKTELSETREKLQEQYVADSFLTAAKVIMETLSKEKKPFNIKKMMDRLEMNGKAFRQLQIMQQQTRSRYPSALEAQLKAIYPGI